jgi:hypothetical protein
MMDVAAIEQLRRLGEEGPRRFSNWDAPLFAAYCRTVLPAMRQVLPAGCERTFAGLSALVHQGIGEGYLKSDPASEPANFLEFCIRDWLPEVLCVLPEEEHLPLLARVWNLGEGLLHEPEWVDGYVMSRIGELRGQGTPEAILIDILRPLLEPAPAARWEGPYRVTLLSLRQADDEFLPGEMKLAAPTVLVVSDRRRPVRLGVHLCREGRSMVVGRFGPNARFPDEPNAVDVEWERGSVRIGDDRVSLAFLAEPFRWAVASAGYVVASASDSQKLWIVESAS